MKFRPGRVLPPWMKSVLKNVYYFPADFTDVLLRRRGDMVPPRRMRFVGDGDFLETGREFFNYFVRFGLITPHSRVLDIGCGIGRMAIPLTTFLKEGSYEGFDIVPKGIEWCRKKISSRFLNFHFQLADIHNMAYNPQGQSQAAEYEFPYESESFDFAFMTSVCTHLLPNDVERYLSETSRVLKKGGKSLVTFFLLNSETKQYVEAGKGMLDFQYHGQGYDTIDESKPESAVAYEEGYVRKLYDKDGLRVLEPIRYGFWSGRREYLSKQDIVLAVK